MSPSKTNFLLKIIRERGSCRYLLKMHSHFVTSNDMVPLTQFQIDEVQTGNPFTRWSVVVFIVVLDVKSFPDQKCINSLLKQDNRRIGAILTRIKTK
jgi:hypothetical protein